MATVAKLLPYELWEIDAVEGWLDDMASQGLIFTHNSGGQFYFREDEPQKLRHRLDFREKHWSHSKERRQFFEDCGWEYLCYVDDRTDLYRTARPDTVEVHTDESILEEIMGKYVRRQKIVLLVCQVLLLLTLAYVVWKCCTYGFFPSLLTNGFWDFFTIPLWLFIAVFGDIRLWRSFRDIKSRALLERSYHTREREQKRRREQRIDFIVRLVIVVLLALDLLQPNQYAAEHLPWEGSGYESYSIHQVLPEDAGDDQRTDLFCWNYPAARRLFQDEKTADGKWNYEVKIYETKSDWLARCYIREQARLAGAQSITVPGHDTAWFFIGTPVSQRHRYEAPDTQNLLLLRGNVVIEIAYLGSADLRSAAETMG